MPENGRGTVQKIWDAIVDPEHGIVAKLARLEQCTTNLEKNQARHAEFHEKLEERTRKLEDAQLTKIGTANMLTSIGRFVYFVLGSFALLAGVILGGILG